MFFPVGRKKHVPRARHASYRNHITDFFLGTIPGQTIIIFGSWILLIFIGAVFWYWADGSDDSELGRQSDPFVQTLWASYSMFIDIGTQTGIHTHEKPTIMIISVAISLTGFMYLLIIMGIGVDLMRAWLDSTNALHKRIVENGHTVILGWSDKVLFLVDEMTEMIQSTKIGESNRRCIVILSEFERFEIIMALRTAFGDMSHKNGGGGSYSCSALTGQHYMNGVRVLIWTGDRTDPYDLDRVSVSSAAHIIAIADPTQPELEADQEVLRAVLALNVVQLHDCGNLDLKTDGPRVLTEMRLTDHAAIVKKLGSGRVRSLVPRVTVNRLLALSSLLPALGKLLSSLVSYDRGCELYEIKLNEKPWTILTQHHQYLHDVARTLSDAIIIGVQRQDEGGDSKPSVFLHPLHLTFKKHPLRATDRLILIARNMRILEQEAHKLKKSVRTAVHKQLKVNNMKVRRLSRRILTGATAEVDPTHNSYAAGSKVEFKQFSPAIEHDRHSGPPPYYTASLRRQARLCIDVEMDYRWDKHMRKVVILGWASDLADLLNSFLMISSNAWGSGQQHLEVHILGGLQRDGQRVRYWQHVAGSPDLVVREKAWDVVEGETVAKSLGEEQSRLKITILSKANGNNDREHNHHNHSPMNTSSKSTDGGGGSGTGGCCSQPTMTVYHYKGNPGKRRYQTQLPLHSATAVLVLSDDDNESALASDSQCLTNLFLAASVHCEGHVRKHAHDCIHNDNATAATAATATTATAAAKSDGIHKAVLSAPPGLPIVPVVSSDAAASKTSGDDDHTIIAAQTRAIIAAQTRARATWRGSPHTPHVQQYLQVVVEILNPSTPKLFRVDALRNPFAHNDNSSGEEISTTSINGNQEDEFSPLDRVEGDAVPGWPLAHSGRPRTESGVQRQKSARLIHELVEIEEKGEDQAHIDNDERNGDGLTSVEYFCTNQLETSIFALNCYNEELSLHYELMVSAMVTPKSSSFIPKFRVVRLKSLLVDGIRLKANENDVFELNFLELQALVLELGFILLGWQRFGASHQEDLAAHEKFLGTIVNPEKKELKYPFRRSDLLLVMDTCESHEDALDGEESEGLLPLPTIPLCGGGAGKNEGL